MSQVPVNTCSMVQPHNNISQTSPVAVPAAMANEHVKRLSDFIEKNRDVSSAVQATAIPESAPAPASEDYGKCFGHRNMMKSITSVIVE